MNKPKLIVKLNGGNPVALCNRCFIMMCKVSCPDENDENCVVLEVNGNDEEDYISTPIGKRPPAYCNKCKRLLTYSVNE